MKFEVRVSRGDRDVLAGLTQRLRDLGPAYTRSGTVVQTSALMRIRSDGPGWPAAAIPNSKGSLLHRTGALANSIKVSMTSNGVQVGTDLQTPTGGYNIGRLMQYGTGPIKPKNGKFLVFEVDGVKIFSKGTKGIPKRPFLFIDSKDAQMIMGVFETYISGGLGAT